MTTDAGGGDDPVQRIRRLVQRAQAPEGSFGPDEAVAAARTDDIVHFLHARFDGAAGLRVLGTGIPASPGAASGRIVLTADAAIDAADRGEAVILVRRETSPDDVLGMQSAKGILTARGGLASHAAVVARGWGIPAVVGLEALWFDDDGPAIGEWRLRVGDELSIDGHTGEVFAGGGAISTASAPPELETLLGWADRLRAGRFAIRANADDAATATHARSLGAEGIGLCRTEHMFLAEDRLPLVRRMILSDNPAEDDAALAALEHVQQQDFEALLAVMDGLPVTVRLLDPPLHEFLPALEPLVVAEALGHLDDVTRAELAAVRRLHEANPMIGTRGVRLGILKPGLYPMQVRAICRAVTARQAAGGTPIIEVMIPLVIDATELRVARRWVEDAEAVVHTTGAARAAISVGTMIETPRAALVAGALAEVADFFSFGTNDLTQLTFAFSRDDVESRLLPHYLATGLLHDNPFEVLDEAGVGFLLRHAIAAARAVDPTLEIGSCGEQAGDPRSARFLVESGLDYVSCSPYRLPVVRLAVAQALLQLGTTARPDTTDGRKGPDATERRKGADATDGLGPDATPQPRSTVDPGTPAAAAPGSFRPTGEGTAAADIADDPGRGASPEAGTVADTTFLVVHALKIKGFAATRVVAEVAGVVEPDAASELQRLLRHELVRFLDARNLWALTPAGRARHAEILPGAPREAISRAGRAYPHFIELNVRFKHLCGAWQVRDGQPNDHTDATYDAERIAELTQLDRSAGPVLSALAAAVPRLGAYRSRLQETLGLLSAGDTDRFTGVLKGSYHDIWMELHEDLLTILGIDRKAEGSF